jgi:folliculin
MHQPRNAEVFSIVRQACLRSLSCEMCPGREGPIFFGDDHRSQVLSHTFVIKDSHARGFEHLFSITIVMMDKIFLLNSWPFLVKHIQLIIDHIKSKASAVYTDEVSRCPPRMHHLPGCSYGPSTTGQAYRLQRGCGSRPTRSLVELTCDSRIFERLHRAFTWMLRAGGSRLTEKLLEGPVFEGSVVDVNRTEETEEGFVKVFSQKGMKIDQTVHRDVSLHDNVSPATMTQRFIQLKHLAKVLGASQFHTVAHNVLIGNQVVVRCDSKLIIRTILDSLQIMLPRGCCHAVYYSNEYLPLYTVNFLGVGPRVSVPVETAFCVLINVTEATVPYQHDWSSTDSLSQPDGTFTQSDSTHSLPYGLSEVMGISDSGPYSILGHLTDSDEIVNLRTFKFDVECSVKTPLAKEPTLLVNIEKTLMNNALSDAVLEQSLICLKEDWMNKVKRWFMFNKVGSSRTKEETLKLMEIIKVQDNDKMLLKFWMSGLSVEYQLSTNSPS